MRRYTDEAGNVTTKANADLDMAVDAMLQADKLDQVLLVTGDGDFIQVVHALQNKGCRVELIGFKNVSRQLQQEVDAFYSGFLIPDLLPVSYEPRNEWGKPGSCVRGVCTKWIADKGYGFLRIMDHISPNLWITDPRDEGSPYTSVFCHVNELADEVTEEHADEPGDHPGVLCQRERAEGQRPGGQQRAARLSVNRVMCNSPRSSFDREQ